MPPQAELAAIRPIAYYKEPREELLTGARYYTCAKLTGRH
jgi:hypothetical protein